MKIKKDSNRTKMDKNDKKKKKNNKKLFDRSKWQFIYVTDFTIK